MKKQLLRLSLLSVLIMLCGGGIFAALTKLTGNRAPAEFKDFAVIVNNQTGTLLTSEEQVQGTDITFGVAVDAEGNTTRVATDDASSIATVNAFTGYCFCQ